MSTEEYFSRFPRAINIRGESYWVNEQILKGEGKEQRSKGVDFFIKELQKGIATEKAKKRTWNQYRVRITIHEENVKKKYKDYRKNFERRSLTVKAD